MSSQAHALPPMPTLISGAASFSTEGDTFNISTDSDLLEWSSFSVAAGQTVDFIQPSGSSGVLNRVQGSSILEVFGVLRSNRPLTLLANNIYVAPGGVIEAPGISLVASESVNMAGLLRGGGILTIGAPSLFVKGPLVSDGVILQTGDYQGSGSLTLGSNGGSFSAVTISMVNPYPSISIDVEYPVTFAILEPSLPAPSDLTFELSSPVPEPTEGWMLIAGLLTLFGLRRKGADGASTRAKGVAH
jgi:filamentous hemagglutinin family protein